MSQAKKVVLPSSESVRREIARVKHLEFTSRVLVVVACVAVALIVVLGVLFVSGAFNGLGGSQGGAGDAGQQQAADAVGQGDDVAVFWGGETRTGTIVACPGDALNLTSTGAIAVNGEEAHRLGTDYTASMVRGMSIPGKVDGGCYLIYLEPDDGSGSADGAAARGTIELVSADLIQMRV